MPNLCDYIMKVTGKRKNVQTFIGYLDNGYHYIKDSDLTSEICKASKENYKLHFVSKDKKTHLFTNDKKHMYRVFDVYRLEEGDKVDGEHYSIVAGDCAWSVYCCMFDGAHTYYSGNIENSDLRQEHSTTIPLLCEELDLSVEVYSSEPGMAFAEHFLVEKGKIIKDECFAYEEIFKEDYPEKSQMEKRVNREISDNEWNDNEYFYSCEINPNDPKWSI